MTKKHYINNENFLLLLKNYKELKDAAIENNTDPPPIPDEIGLCILNISQGLAKRPNFSSYTFKEDMVSDGIENCIRYLDNFDPEKSKNPFSYFTQIIYYAFLRRIQEESKETYVKFKSFETHELYTNHGYEMTPHIDMIQSIVNENTQDIITKFETRMAENSIKQKKKKKEKQNLESLMN